jgi:tetratricopeptide (TPR) repeat protein
MNQKRNALTHTEQREDKQLEGYIELGMAREALQLARCLLARPGIAPKQFSSAANAILVQADKLKQWRIPLEKAYACLSESGQRLVRPEMFRFYVSLEDWEGAYRFLSTRPRHSSELLFSMWTLLNLNKPAKSVQRKCLRALRTTTDPFDTSNLLEALASYHARAGELEAAENYWRKSAVLEPFAHNALVGLVEIAVVRGQLLAKAGLSLIERFKKTGQDEQAITLPRNRDSVFQKAERDLKRYHGILQKIVPPGNLGAFGVTPEDV